MFTVYMHKTPSGKVYIGITSKDDVGERFGPNGLMYRNQVFGKAIKKYGWNNIEHIIVKSGLTEEEAKQEEIRLIAEYNSTDSRFGYNVSLGGNIPSIYGNHHTEETKHKISESNKNKIRTPEFLQKVSEGVKRVWQTDDYREKQMSRVVTEETRQKQSLAHLGKSPTEETRQKMSLANKGKHNFSPEQRLSIAETVRAQHQKEKELGIRRTYVDMGLRTAGTKWYNNGIKNIRVKGDCPEGFVPGRIKIPTYDDVEDRRTTERKVEEGKKSYGDKTDVF